MVSQVPGEESESLSSSGKGPEFSLCRFICAWRERQELIVIQNAPEIYFRNSPMLGEGFQSLLWFEKGPEIFLDNSPVLGKREKRACY